MRQHVLSEEEEQRIGKDGNMERRTEILLDILEMKPSEMYGQFLEIVSDIYPHVYLELTSDGQDEGNVYCFYFHLYKFIYLFYFNNIFKFPNMKCDRFLKHLSGAVQPQARPVLSLCEFQLRGILWLIFFSFSCTTFTWGLKLIHRVLYSWMPSSLSVALEQLAGHQSNIRLVAFHDMFSSPIVSFPSIRHSSSTVPSLQHMHSPPPDRYPKDNVHTLTNIYLSPTLRILTDGTTDRDPIYSCWPIARFRYRYSNLEDRYRLNRLNFIEVGSLEQNHNRYRY